MGAYAVTPSICTVIIPSTSSYVPGSFTKGSTFQCLGIVTFQQCLRAKYLARHVKAYNTGVNEHVRSIAWNPLKSQTLAGTAVKPFGRALESRGT